MRMRRRCDPTRRWSRVEQAATWIEAGDSRALRVPTERIIRARRLSPQDPFGGRREKAPESSATASAAAKNGRSGGLQTTGFTRLSAVSTRSN